MVESAAMAERGARVRAMVIAASTRFTKNLQRVNSQFPSIMLQGRDFGKRRVQPRIGNAQSVHTPPAKAVRPALCLWSAETWPLEKPRRGFPVRSPRLK